MEHGRLIRAGPAAVGLVAVIVTVALLLPGRGTASEDPRGRTPARRALPAPVRVLPLGDSITWGLGSATHSSYRRPLWSLVAGQSQYRVRFVGRQVSGDLPEPQNEGHVGYTIDQIGAGLDGWLAAARPDVVVLHIGINDLNRGTDVRHAPDRLAALVSRIYADRPGVAVVLMGLIPTTPGLGRWITPYNERARALGAVERRAGRQFDYVAAPALTRAEMVDRLHPNDAGYRRIARAIFPALSRAVAERSATAAGARTAVPAAAAR